MPSPPGGGQVIAVVQVRGDIDVTNADGLREALTDETVDTARASLLSA